MNLTLLWVTWYQAGQGYITIRWLKGKRKEKKKKKGKEKNGTERIGTEQNKGLAGF